MPNEKETSQVVRLVVSEKVTNHLIRVGRLVVTGVALQLVLICYLTFGQPASKIDARFLTVMNTLLDVDARIGQMEREQAVLFRMLRNENEQRGVPPDRVVIPEPTIPLPPVPKPPPSKRIGDASGDWMGDMPDA